MNGLWYPGVACDCSYLLLGLQSPLPPPFLCSLTPLSQTSDTLQSTPWHILSPGPFSIFPGCFWCTHSVNVSFQCQVGSAIRLHLPALHQGFLWLLPTVLPVPAYRQETSHFCSTFGFCLCQYSWLLIQTHVCFGFFLLGQPGIRENEIIFAFWVLAMYWRDLKWIFACDFLHSRLMWWVETAFYIPGLETCSLNYVWVAGLNRRRPALFSSCSWGGLYFLATSTEKEKAKEIISTGEGVEFENTLFSCHKKLHIYNSTYTYTFKRTLAGERLLMCELFRIASF